MRPETFMLAAGAALMGYVLYLAITTSNERTPVPPAPTPGASVTYAPYVFLDQVTGCQYLSTHTSSALAPRIAADGKTHMGCGVKP